MRNLVRKPVLLALVLVLPLWIVFNNFIVAIMVALLAAFFLTMCHALYVLKRAGSRPEEPPRTARQDTARKHTSAKVKIEN